MDTNTDCQTPSAHAHVECPVFLPTVYVGAEPPQMEGVATSGVALQEPGSVHGSSRRVQAGSVQKEQCASPI